MEEKIFLDVPEVRRELERFVEVRLHIDVEQDWSRRLRKLNAERLRGNAALPIYEIVDPRTGQQLDKFVGADLFEKGAPNFRAFLARHRDGKP